MTESGARLLWMLQTTADAKRPWVRWPRAFDARLVERIAEEFVPRIEAEAVATERARIAREWAEAKRTKGSVMHDVGGVLEVVDAILEPTP
jgi:hypothetical protein